MRVVCIDPELQHYYCVPEPHEDPETTLYLAGMFLQRYKVAGIVHVGGELSYDGVEVIRFTPHLSDLEERWARFVEALNEAGIDVQGDLSS